jgi:hypothetical protein
MVTGATRSGRTALTMRLRICILMGSAITKLVANRKNCRWRMEASLSAGHIRQSSARILWCPFCWDPHALSKDSPTSAASVSCAALGDRWQ